MRPAHSLLLFRVLVLLALGASTALLVDYISADPAFCGVDSGCSAIRRSGLGHLPIPGLGLIPLPLVGVGCFSLLYTLSLALSPLVRKRWCAPLAYAVAVVGAGLLVTQLLLGTFCLFCVIVDVASLGIGALAFRLRHDGWDRASYEETSDMQLVDPSQVYADGRRVPSVWRDDSRIYTPPTPLVRKAPSGAIRLHRGAWSLLCFLAVLGPWAFPSVARRSSAPPSVVQLHQAGRVNVVEFFDFECPHCRELGPRLDALLHARGDQVHFVRRHVPLPAHPHARDAARHALCAAEQGKEDAVTRAFLTSDDLSVPRLRELALGLGVKAPELDTCLASKRPDVRLAEDQLRLIEAGFEGLPTTYVGGYRILGARNDAIYVEALDKVARHEDEEGLAPAAYWALFTLLVGLVVWFGRKKRSAG